MIIEKLYLMDFRGIHNLELELSGKSVLLYGINGVGKSSILAGITLLYASILNRLVRQKFKQSINFEDSDIRYKKASAVVAAEFGFEDTQDIFYVYRQIDRSNKKYMNPRKNQFDALVDHFEQLYIGEPEIDEDNNLCYQNENFSIPIFVNYGVNRLVLKTPLRISKNKSYGQYSAYEKAIENQIAFDRLFEWFLEQELYETQMKKEKEGYEDIPLKAVKTAMLAMLDGFKDIHIMVKPYSMKVYKGTETLDILQLSDGEKCTLALFGDLARRLAIANPSMKNPLEGQGVVLIDEIELHMHTLWQRKIINVLKKTFPNIQFIITTHSPQVLGEVSDDFNVFTLQRELDETHCERVCPYFGVDSNIVLEDALHTDSVSRVIKEKVSTMYGLLDNKDYDEAEKVADEIDQITLHRNADTVKARIIIRKGRRLNAAYTKDI
ncbi:MAG: AAA family ATPase [Lachnospiraceae bacterium]|nr:AAA family ATPase [Lachnospiraceae bacterium]